MSKSLPDSRFPDFEGIPLPETLRAAFSSVPKTPYLSHSASLDERFLNSENHAFYIGKYIPQTPAERIKSLMGGQDHERIYNEAFLVGMLESLFAHLAPQEKTRIVLAPELSEIFNGPEDVSRALSAEDLKALIFKLAKKIFNKEPESLDIVTLSEIPEHQKLFERLRKKGSQKALEGNSQLSETPDSLEIAQLLYAASQKDDRLQNAFLHAIPGRLYDEEENELGSKGLYALCEVAIRLSDLLHGKTFQGGCERQAIYDDIIKRLIRGTAGSYKHMEGLEPLFEKLKDVSFETLHLQTDLNPHRLKRIQRLAQTRLLLLGLVGALGAFGMLETGRHLEKQDQDKREASKLALIREKTSGINFYFEGRLKMDEASSVGHVKSLISVISEQLRLRYQISDDMLAELEPFIGAFLLRDPNLLPYLDDNPNKLTMAADQFYKENALYLASKGLGEIKPYAHLDPYLKSLKDFTETTSELEMNHLPLGFKSLGTLEWRYQRVTLYQGVYLGKTIFLGSYYEGPNATYSTQNVKTAYEILEATRKNFDAQPFISQQIPILNSVMTNVITPPREFSVPADDFHLEHLPDYRDSHGAFAFEIALYSFYEPKSMKSTLYWVARKPGESHFNSKTGREAARHYLSAVLPHIDLTDASRVRQD